jgi:transposase
MADISLPLDINSLEITNQTLDDKGNIILDVVSKCSNSKCHKCGKPATKRNGYSSPIMVQHTKILERKVYLRIKPVRYECKHCDDHPSTTEQYDWCDRNAKVTKAMEEYIMRSLINSTIEDVSRKERISYKTIVRAVKRQINTEVDWSQYTDLETLGLDEISDKKGHQDYLVIISVKSKSGELSVIAVLDDRTKVAVKAFLDSIPDRLKKTVKTVCTDMWDGYVYAAIEVFGQQAVVIDRFHVAKLYRAPLDKLRIKEMKRLKDELDFGEYAKLNNMMWILRKKHECLSEANKESLELLYKYSPDLKKAHSYALKLTNIFNAHSKRKPAMAKIDRWIAKVEKSNINIFNKFISTLKKYKGQIANYFKDRKSSGFVEGLNNKIKVMKRRCYGLGSVESYFQRLWLDFKGYAVYGL